MLMSYGAGSVGLNLQFANYVFLFDRWWNPAVEDFDTVFSESVGTPRGGLSREEVFSLFNLNTNGNDVRTAA
jgi:hypothetical protein